MVYRRYAGLYFCLCVDPSDNELAALEAIHLFVEVLDMYFKSVCELDLVFYFYKVRFKLFPARSKCIDVRKRTVKLTYISVCFLSGVCGLGRNIPSRRSYGDESPSYCGANSGSR